MTCYSILQVTSHDEDWKRTYAPAVNALVAKHGGRYLVRSAKHERMEGEGGSPELWVILEWPSRDAAIAFMNDPNFAPHLKRRHDCTESHHWLVEGMDDMGT